jgi:hypothetical protein
VVDCSSWKPWLNCCNCSSAVYSATRPPLRLRGHHLFPPFRTALVASSLLTHHNSFSSFPYSPCKPPVAMPPLSEPANLLICPSRVAGRDNAVIVSSQRSPYPPGPLNISAALMSCCAASPDPGRRQWRMLICVSGDFYGNLGIVDGTTPASDRLER